MVQYVMAWLNLRFNFAMDEEEGQGLVEYALILVLISVAAIIVMTALGKSVSGVFSSISGTINSANTTSS